MQQEHAEYHYKWDVMVTEIPSTTFYLSANEIGRRAVEAVVGRSLVWEARKDAPHFLDINLEREEFEDLRAFSNMVAAKNVRVRVNVQSKTSMSARDMYIIDNREENSAYSLRDTRTEPAA